MSFYILSFQRSDWDQSAERFVIAFNGKPTVDEIKKTIAPRFETDEYFNHPENQEKLINHILSGGGRRGNEEVWYNLREMKVIPYILS